MSAVRIENAAWSDDRFEDLAARAGHANRFEAIGRMAFVWSWCTDNNTNVVPAHVIRRRLGPDGVEAIIDADLGEQVEGGIRIKGASEKRIGWKAKLETIAVEGGKARAAKGARNGGLYATSQQVQPGASQEPASDQPHSSQEPAENQPESSAPSPSPSPNRERESGCESQPALELELAQPEPSASPRVALEAKARAIALAAISELNRLTSSRYEPDGKAVLDDARKIASNGFTPEDASRVVEAKVREWATDPKMAKQLKPSVLLRPSNFARYVGDVRGGNGARASPSHLAEVVPIRRIQPL